MRINELFENITPHELDHVEQIADALWSKLGVDVEFTRHFFDRVNDERNGRPITADELIAMFQKEFKTNGIQISNMRRPEAVLKDLLSSINIPFVLKRNGDEKELVAKTVMRKRDFKSPDPAYIVKELFDNGVVSWNWGSKTKTEAEAHFKIGELEYTFYAYAPMIGSASKPRTAWEIEFRISNPFYNGDSRFGIEKTGNSTAVMSTVVAITKSFLEQYNSSIDKLIFSAEEDSRKKLYARMIRRLLPTWGYEQTGGNFILTKPVANSLNELFDNGAAKWGWSYRGSEEVEASFGVEDVEYKFYAYTVPKVGPGVWDVEFRISTPDYKGTRFGVANTGNSAIVMSTIVSILKAFLQEYEGKVTKLIFSAKEDSRRKLYARMVRRLLPTWGYEQTGGNFTLTKPTGVIKPQSL